MDTLFAKPEFAGHDGIPVLEKFGFTLNEEQECKEAIEEYRNKVVKKQQIETENNQLEIELNQLTNLNTMITKLTQSHQTKLVNALNGESEQAEINHDNSTVNTDSQQ